MIKMFCLFFNEFHTLAAGVGTLVNDPYNPHSLSANQISHIYTDTKGRLWIATTNGLNLYDEFTDEQISDKIAEMICNDNVKAKVKTFFQTVEKLNKACPKNLGDWYFTGNYPTAGGNRVVNKAFINFYEGNKERAY